MDGRCNLTTVVVVATIVPTSYGGEGPVNFGWAWADR